MFGDNSGFGVPNFGGNNGFNNNPFGQSNPAQPPHMQQLMPSTGGIQPVIDQNGVMHYERRVGNMRYDIADPTSMDYIINETPNVRTVIDEHGNIRYEQENGWLRWNW